MNYTVDIILSVSLVIAVAGFWLFVLYRLVQTLFYIFWPGLKEKHTKRKNRFKNRRQFKKMFRGKINFF